MSDRNWVALAEEAGFRAVEISTGEIPVDGKFRKFCQDNLCGKYDANYSCPPACGTVEEVRQRLYAKKRALVLQIVRKIGSYDNKVGIQDSRNELNTAVLALTEKLRQAGLSCLPLGYGGCNLCTPCGQRVGKPCPFPEKRISCMSAYCIDVGALAGHCGLPFAWEEDTLYLFGLIAFSPEA